MAQVFFVISGFVMAKTMSGRHWTRGEFGRFLAHRYCRLGLPYLAVIVLAMVACAIGRGWLPDELIGPPPKLSQLLAHTIFLQDILGYGSMSAGLWFVCINFQLGLLYALMLWMRDTLVQSKTAGNWEKLPLAAGFLLSLCSLFYFNLHDPWSVWCVYYFGEFFLGVLAEAALRDPAMRKWFAGYVMIVAAALAEHWRWRLTTSTCAGLLLYFSELRGARQLWWSANGIVSYLGRTSYSLFLVHYPVLLVVAAVWMRMGWNSTSQIIGGLAIAFVASLAAAGIFYRFVEAAAARLSRTTKRTALHGGAERGEADAQIGAAIAPGVYCAVVWEQTARQCVTVLKWVWLRRRDAQLKLCCRSGTRQMASKYQTGCLGRRGWNTRSNRDVVRQWRTPGRGPARPLALRLWW